MPNHFDLAIQQLLENVVEKNMDVVVLDVGANMGQSILRFRRYLAQATFHSFEPLPHCHAMLLDRFAGEQYVHNNVALSDVNDVREFYEYRKADTSSFLLPDEASEWASRRAETWSGGDPGGLISNRLEVTAMTLDNYLDCSDQLANSRIHLLKMDTQGHEREVLIGATKLLADPDRRPLLIEAELILGAMYEKQQSFFDIEQVLVPCGYRLIGVSRMGNLVEEPWLSLDVLYASPEIEPLLPR